MHRILSAVSQREFLIEFYEARCEHPKVRLGTSSAYELEQTFQGGARCYLSEDKCSGFAVTATGELVGLFSSVGGRGSYLVDEAVAWGAKHLDCFDGYLRKLYEAHGFVVHKREPNWTDGEPDVVYMQQDWMEG